MGLTEGRGLNAIVVSLGQILPMWSCKWITKLKVVRTKKKKI